MNRLSKILIGSLAGACCFGAATLGLTSVVEYFPYGVPEHRRKDYDRKIAELVELKALSESGTLQAEAIVNNKVYDFGLLNPHQTASHAFEIKNAGEAPLKLEVLDSTCKCTVGKLDSPFVAPGKSTEVKLTWNTGYQNEAYEQSVTLKTNDPRRKSLKLTVKGDVRAELVVPEKLAFENCDAGEHAKAEFVVYSQLWDDFEVSEVTSELRDFNWLVEPIEVNSPELGDAEAKSAYKVKVFTFQQEHGKFEGEFGVNVTPPGGAEAQNRTVAVTGYVRSPIGFYSPEIHKQTGLDIGTIVVGKKREFHLTVRARCKETRKLAILDAEPKTGLKFELNPNTEENSYRLSIVVPEDCPRVIFNGDHKHGFVQVGDPEDKSYSNWFPLRGAVVVLDE